MTWRPNDLTRRTKKFARDRALSVGVVANRATRAERIDALVADLRPQAIDLPLIRLGSATDGGYIIPDDLGGDLVAISPGVAQEISFDLALAERGIDVLMLDASVPGPPARHPRFRFWPQFLDSYESATTTTLSSLIQREVAEGYDVLLEMDIEGAEYRVIHSLCESDLARFRIMVIEFHDLVNLAIPSRFPDIEAAFRKLLRTHIIVHAHPNNAAFTFGPSNLGAVVEFTFIRRDRVTPTGEPALLPNPLDRDCVAYAQSATLPVAWR